MNHFHLLSLHRLPSLGGEIPRHRVLLHRSFKPLDDKYTTTQAQFLPIAVEGHPNFYVSVVQSFNSFVQLPRSTCYSLTC